MLPWRDVLHEGPVRAGLSLEQLSEERIAFIAGAGWGAPEEVRAAFHERDAALRTAGRHEEVVLWFEHDLYDQLQLIQILDWFSHNSHPRVTLVCEAEYVGTMSPARMRELFPARKPVTPASLQEASDAWAAFTAPDPSGMNDLEIRALPFLGAVLRRQLQEYPWTIDDLSLLERRVLDSLHRGPLHFVDLFVRIRDEPVFLGDLVFQWRLEQMEKEGLVGHEGRTWMLKSRKQMRRVPRWLGGVRVDEQCPWRWDPAAGKLVRI